MVSIRRHCGPMRGEKFETIPITQIYRIQFLAGSPSCVRASRSRLHPYTRNLQLDSRSFLRTRRRGWGCCESCLQKEQKRVGRNMEIEINGCMYKQAETSN